MSKFSRRGQERQGWCRDCFRSYFKERGEVHRRQSAEAKKARRERAFALIDEIKQQAFCADCGLHDPALFEFDHVRNKTKEISRLAAEGASSEALENEIRNCQIVCANCHRRRTAHRAKWRRAAPRWWRTPAPQPWTRARNVAYIYSYLERTPCGDCGEKELPLLEFHHLGRKEANVSEMAWDSASLDRLQREVAECVVLCANCHRRRTLATSKRNLVDGREPVGNLTGPP